MERGGIEVEASANGEEAVVTMDAMRRHPRAHLYRREA